jgi:hypothetical protein
VERSTLYKKIILVLVFSIYSFAEVINNKEIDKEYFMLFINKTKTIDDLKKDINDVEVFDYSIVEASDNYFELYIVNISTYEEILEYKKAFKNAVITKNFDSNPKNKLYSNSDNKKVKKLNKIKEFKDLSKEYNRALNTFEKGNYKESYHEFYKLFLLKMDDIKYNFYLGRSAFELRQYEEAQSIFERILLYEPNSTRTKLELARTYYEVGMYKDSISLFNEVKSQKNIDPLIEKNIDYFLKMNENKITKHFIKGSLILSASYDDNIFNDSFNDSFHPTLLSRNNFIGDEGIPSSAKKTDSSHNEILSVNYVYKRNDDLLFKIDTFVYNQIYKKYSDKNLQLIGLNPKISKAYNERLVVDYGFYIDNLWQGSDNYLTSYGLSPGLKYLISKDLLIDANIKYLYKKAQSEENENDDSKVIKIQLGLLKIIDNQLSIYSSIVFSKEYEKYIENDDINQDIISFATNLDYKLTDKFNINTGIGYSNGRYKDLDSWYLKKRIDNEVSFNLGGSYEMFKESFLNLAYNYTKNNSNIDYVEYYKNKITLSYIKNFKD